MERIKVIGRVEGSSIHLSLFLCPQCGEQVVRQSSNGLRSKNCGCIPKATTHGLKKYDIELYRKWSNMRARCYNDKSSQYPWYGAKGIGVWSGWNDFKAFHEWAYENGFEKDKNLALSRVDHSLDYHPTNCKFESISENCKEAMERRWENTRD